MSDIEEVNVDHIRSGNREIRIEKLPPQFTSLVWKHFGFLYIGGTKQSSSNYCVECFKKGKESIFGPKTSTSNLGAHLKTHDIQINESPDISESKRFMNNLISADYRPDTPVLNSSR